MRANARALCERLAGTDRAVEVGIGRRPEVAAELARRGVTVIATDINERSVSAAVQFVRDDVTAPTRSVYAEADVLYARNLPPELHVPVTELARAVEAACLFTTLGGDPAVVPVRRERLPAGTLYRACE